MDKPLENKVAIVTGAGRGIGREIALTLGRNGATVVLAARSEGQLEEAAEEIKQFDSESFVVPFDLADEESICNLVESVKERFGRLDILVNNAGITHSGLLEEISTADFDRVMTVNVRGAFILCRETLGLLKQSAAGKIVNICSVVGIKGYPRQSVYTASKHALRGMSISLAEELRETNVRVHVICPGGVDTELVGGVRPDIPKEELIDPKEIAELVGYLVTHKGNAVIDELRIRRASSGPWF